MVRRYRYGGLYAAWFGVRVCPGSQALNLRGSVGYIRCMNQGTPEAALLNLGPGAGLDEIKKAYRRAALVLHPDQNPHPDAARRFRKITEAYRVLEAQAGLRSPGQPRKASWNHWGEALLGDLADLVRRWPDDRWDQRVDGLTPGIWLASVLEVLVREWTGGPPPQVFPSRQGLVEALALWSDLGRRYPVPTRLNHRRAQRLTATLEAAETRLKALRRFVIR